MAFLFPEPQPKQVEVFVKIKGQTQKFIVDTEDYREARTTLIQHLNEGFQQHGAVLALIR